MELEQVAVSIVAPIILALIAAYPAVLSARKTLSEAREKQEAEERKASEEQHNREEAQLVQIQAAVSAERDKLWTQAAQFQASIMQELERCKDELQREIDKVANKQSDTKTPPV